MKTLVIYDNQGYVIQQISGSYRVPVGVPSLEVVIPEGKRVVPGVGVNVTVNPHQVFLEPIPNYEIEYIKQQLSMIQEVVDFLLLSGGGQNG